MNNDAVVNIFVCLRIAYIRNETKRFHSDRSKVVITSIFSLAPYKYLYSNINSSKISYFL